MVVSNGRMSSIFTLCPKSALSGTPYYQARWQEEKPTAARDRAGTIDPKPYPLNTIQHRVNTKSESEHQSKNADLILDTLTYSWYADVMHSNLHACKKPMNACKDACKNACKNDDMNACMNVKFVNLNAWMNLNELTNECIDK